MSRPAETTDPMPAALRAAGWMTLTLASFVGLAIAGRELAGQMSTFQILTIRSAGGMCIVLPLLLARQGLRGLATSRPGLQIARNAVHFAGQYGWLWAVGVLPLGTVFALEFTQPVWIALAAWAFLGERLNAHRIVAIAGGFLGVLVILRPGASAFDPQALVVLGAAVAFAGSVLMVKVLTRTDPALRILFYMSLLQLPMGLIPALPGWVTPAVSDLPWLVVVTLTGLTAHYGLARALAIADATVVAPLEFLRLPLIALIGFALYAEPLEPWTLAGAVVIFAANYQAVVRETRRPGGDRRQ